MNDTQCYSYAKKASYKSDFHKSHTGCIAVYAGHVLAEGWNTKKTSSMQTLYNRFREFDPERFPGYMHAEMMVLQKIRYLDIDFSKVKIYVYRGNDHPRISKPCASCERALRDIGIRKVFYTGNQSYISEKYD